jgi:hypothetical protein
MEKRNVIEKGRTPGTTEKTADTVDQAVSSFKRLELDEDTKEMPAVNKNKDKDNVESS